MDQMGAFQRSKSVIALQTAAGQDSGACVLGSGFRQQ